MGHSIEDVKREGGGGRGSYINMLCEKACFTFLVVVETWRALSSVTVSIVSAA